MSGYAVGAEVLAINTAEEFLSECGKSLDRIVIFTDSMSTLQALDCRSRPADPEPALLPYQTDSSDYSDTPMTACLPMLAVREMNNPNDLPKLAVD